MLPPAATARARVRAELTQEIISAGRQELAEVGAAALSLRSVARRLGMAPSALYRYYDSRDHLLTALIIDAYDTVALAAVRADRSAGNDCWARWLEVGRGVRRWSARHPHEWALVFGSPVPGYVGSERTSEAAARLHRVPFDILLAAYGGGFAAREPAEPAAPRVAAPAASGGRTRVEQQRPTGARQRGSMQPGAAAAADGPVRPSQPPPLGPTLAMSIAPLVNFAPGLPPAVAAAGLSAWGMVLGTISLERFGHFTGVVEDLDVYFDHTVGLAAGLVGLGAPAGRALR